MRIDEEINELTTLPSQGICNEASPTIPIEAAKPWPSLNLHELWEYHELIYFLIWRDIKVRYKQTILGAGWAIIQPLFTMVLFTLFFGRLARVPSDGVRYSLFAFTGLVPWTYFSSGLTQASSSLIGNSSLIKKIYFPRLAIPIAKTLSALVDFGLAFALLLGMTVYYDVHLSLRILFVPLFLLLAIITALGASFWLSAMNVQVRDVAQALPFLAQLWLFATPVAYPSSLLSPPWRTLYGLNPMVGVVEGFRWALLRTETTSWPMLVLSSIVATAMLVSGAFWFRHMERTFADVL
jgi:lipopolysaccharide transport system permease protein